MAWPKGVHAAQLAQQLSLSGSFAAGGLAAAAAVCSAPTALAWEAGARAPDGRLVTGLGATGYRASGKVVRRVDAWGDTTVVRQWQRVPCPSCLALPSAVAWNMGPRYRAGRTCRGTRSTGCS